MNVLVEFLLNNYIWFLVIALIIIFALVGYLVDITTPKIETPKIKPIKNMVNQDEKIVHPSVEAYTNEDFDEPLIKDK